MPTVISKFLEKTEPYQAAINKTNLSKAFLAACLVTYGYKIGYPLVESLVKKSMGCGPNKENVNVNNNLLHKGKNGSKDANRQKNGRVSGGDIYGKKKAAAATADTKVPTLNFEFISQFFRLLRIMIPSPFCIETTLLSGHTVFLFLRTFLSIYVANLEGVIVKFIVRKDPQNFLKQLLKWFMVAIPATFINSMIRYLECRIALSFRSRLVEHSYKLYFKNQSYYRVSVLDSRLENCSQRLTDDIETVSSVVSHLYGHITKPLFDILLMWFALARLTKSKNANIVVGPLLISGVVCASAFLLKLLSPRFGQLVAQEAEKKGYLRHVHQRLVTNSEEIAFYGGHKVEQSHLKAAYRVLVEHMEKIFGVKLWFIMLEQFLMKYVWSGAGMVMVSLPILLSNVKSKDSDGGISERTHYFTTAKNLLLTGSAAVERLMSSYKEVVELAGHTARVENMFTVLDEASRGIYKKTVVEKKEGSTTGFQVEMKNGQPVAKGKIIASTNNEISLTDVPIVTPNCDVVCPSLTLQIKPGMHLLITGPNGCGKSSLFRILCGLWPIYAGELRMPPNAMFYIPQRPYMVIGNLRDQIIYPDTPVDMINRQMTERDLRNVMKMAHLDHIIERDGFEAVKDWTDILSGGEKQRMAIARLFYHKPKYALLDECTSAISIDVEANIYQTAIDLGITLLTITHRPTLWKFHTHILQFDGAGTWSFSELNADSRLDLKTEKEQLLKEPASEQRNARLQELSKLLGEDIDE